MPFWRGGCFCHDLLQFLIFRRHGDVPKKHSKRRNALTNIERIMAPKKVLAVKEKGIGRCTMMWQEQNQLSSIKYMLYNFSRDGNLVIDPCSGIFAAAKICMHFSHHGRFFRQNVDSSCIDQALPNVV